MRYAITCLGVAIGLLATALWGYARIAKVVVSTAATLMQAFASGLPN